MTITPAGSHRLVDKIALEFGQLASLGEPDPPGSGDPLGICCRHARLQAYIDAATWTLDPADRRDLMRVIQAATCNSP